MIKGLIIAWASGSIMMALSLVIGFRVEDAEDPAGAEITRELERDWGWHAYLLATCAFWPIVVPWVLWRAHRKRAR